MKILVVEDDRALARILLRALTEHLYSGEAVHDGESGRHRALSGDFDLMILDVMLPKLDGIQVCQAVRAAGKMFPILLLTAKDSVEDRIRGLDAGADDYLVKPFSIGELLARVRALIRRVQARSEDLLTVGGIVLDPRTDYVQIGERKVTLTAKEFALLKCLMCHPDKILSRTEILEKVWDSNYEGLGNVVDVYVNHLRNKLEEEGEPRRIETVRGRGYVLRSI